MSEQEQYLLTLCDRVYVAQRKAEEDAKRRAFGDGPSFEYLVMRKDKVRVELRREEVGHHEPHIHVTHSDKIDASICLRDFRILAGNIDRRTLKYLLQELRPKQERLLKIWSELNEKNNSVAAEKMISNLFN